MANVRVVKTTDDFIDEQIARDKEIYRLRYLCAGCSVELWDEIYDGKVMFGSGSVLKSNKHPCYCPYCGTRADTEEA